jgi:predicted nucleotidyltransferase/uncharacterized protein YutE (UPF0331/DUF86 family)
VDATGGTAEAVRLALEPFGAVRFAVLFGSAAEGRLRADSDIDVAVYVDSRGALEIEADRELDAEAEIQLALERATNRNIDLLLLNRAPATVCAAAITSGIPALMRDAALFRRYYLAVTDVAALFLRTEQEFREIRTRSASLSAIDRSRLERILEFVDDEMQDQPAIAGMTLDRYRRDRDARRSMDRWVETLVSAAIDTAKTILASLRRPVPQTYGQILADLEALPEFAHLSGRLKPFAALRNLMAHEYLDLRWSRVKDCASTGSTTVTDLAAAARGWLSAQPPPP